MRHPKVGFLVQQGLGFPILQIHVYMRVVVMILVARGEGLAYADLLPGQLAASELDNVLVPQGTPRLCLLFVHR